MISSDDQCARPAAKIPLYHVAFRPTELWPDAKADEVVVEVFEHWLERNPAR